MNIRRGFFRLTLLLSILVGIVSSFPLLEHAIKNPDGIVQRSLPYGLQIRISNEGIDRAVERAVIRSYGYNSGEHNFAQSKTHESFGPDYVLYWWRHLAVLSIPGFVAIWFIYGLTGWVIVPFIVRGFQGSSARGGETD
jgi:hypothetical protein